jgi:hypothetical protein
MKAIFYFIFLLLFSQSGAVAAEWTIDQKFRDPVTSEIFKSATTTNADGVSIHIYRIKTGKVVGLYSLPESSLDRLPSSGRLLIMRPGEKSSDEIEIDPNRSKVLESAWTDGLQIRETLWHGHDPSPTRGTLRDILDSDRLYLRFYTDTGSKIDSVVDLAGARSQISAALGIEATADPVAVAEDEQRTELSLAATKRCLTQSTAPACLAAYVDCADHINGKIDVAGFHDCLAAKGYPLP